MNSSESHQKKSPERRLHSGPNIFNQRLSTERQSHNRLRGKGKRKHTFLDLYILGVKRLDLDIIRMIEIVVGSNVVGCKYLAGDILSLYVAERYLG